MQCKRGLSDIVSTVLIILLALAAVAIVWGFISLALRQSGASISNNDLCLSADITPVKCEYTYDGTGYTLTNIILKHSGGEDVKSMKAVLTLGEGADETTEIEDAVSIGLLSTHNFATQLDAVITNDGYSDLKPTGLEAGASITTEDGKEFTCPQVSSKIACTPVGSAPPAALLCDNGIDDDADGETDLLDYGCTSTSDNSELGTTQCGDGTDNDVDSAVDQDDTGCSGPADNAEANCGNGILETSLGELCDDGNTVTGDGCSATCTIQTGWTCPTPGAACNGICGDLLVVGSEECDAGPSGGSSSDCTVSFYCNSDCTCAPPAP